MSCGEIGLHRTILPQPQVQKVGKKVPGTLPGKYTEELNEKFDVFLLLFMCLT